MTVGAVDRMTLCQREKRVIHIGCVPGDTVYRMTLNTIFRKISLHMIWTGCTHVIGLVAVIALYSERFKTEQRSRFVTTGAVGCSMGTQKRETAALMEFGNIFHKP